MIEYTIGINDTLPTSASHNYLRKCIDEINNVNGLGALCEVRWAIIEPHFEESGQSSRRSFI